MFLLRKIFVLKFDFSLNGFEITEISVLKIFKVHHLSRYIHFYYIHKYMKLLVVYNETLPCFFLGLGRSKTGLLKNLMGPENRNDTKRCM